MRESPALFRGLCDDAAVFPPGLAPLPDAVAAHLRHRTSWYAGMIGPLVLPASSLAGYQALCQPLPLCLTFPDGPGPLSAALRETADADNLQAVEVAVPPGMSGGEAVGLITAAVCGRTIDVAVEVPRDARRDSVLQALAGSPYRAKFRTGGTRSDAYPDEDELASAVLAAVNAGVPFKATAGLHHATRNTDTVTGFEQHGFLNLLLATDAAMAGATKTEIVLLLAERDAPEVRDRVRALTIERIAGTRQTFTSFGTCSIADPVNELIGLGLLESDVDPRTVSSDTRTAHGPSERT